jgi:hypothetical protein
MFSDILKFWTGKVGAGLNENCDDKWRAFEICWCDETSANSMKKRKNKANLDGNILIASSLETLL